MAAFLMIVDFDGTPFTPNDAQRAAIARAMNERSPGLVEERAVPGARCWYCGQDGLVVAEDGLLLAVDGRPNVVAAGRTTGVPPQVAPADWRNAGTELLPSLDGGFSLTAHDQTNRELVLARDRFGARPLFWTEQEGRIYVASEVKILAAAGIALHVSPEALDEVLVCRWLLRDRSLFASVRQVPAASCLTFRPGSEPVVRRYWRLQFAPEAAGSEALNRYRDEARTAMRSAVLEAASGRSEIGVLLSGGVDSSIIAAVAREVGAKVVAFAGRLPNGPNPELDRALVVARHIDIECRVVDIETPVFNGDMRALVRRMEQPPRHPNNFLLQQLFRRAAQEVDLVLQGDAAEMLFGLADERRVGRFSGKHQWIRRLPHGRRHAIGRALGRLDGTWATRVSRVLTWSPVTYALMLDTVGYSSEVQRTLPALVDGEPPAFLPVEYFSEYDDNSDALQAYQLYTFAAASLVRHDRLAQPLGLTSESPFLRAPVVDFACRLPRALRYLDGSKPVLRALCDLYLPHKVSQWPKLGFPVPWEDWMRRARPQGVETSEFLRKTLPSGFLEAARAAGDDEAMWTALTLQIVAEELGVD